MGKSIKEIINIVGSILTIVTSSIFFFPSLTAIGTSIVSSFYFRAELNLFDVIIIVVSSLIIFIYLSVRSYQRRNRELYETLNKILTEFGKLFQTSTKETAIIDMENACTTVVDVFHKLRGGQKPALSITIIVSDNGQLLLKTLCRDKYSTSQRHENTSINHNLLDNTAYKNVILNLSDENDSFFLSNDILKETEYKSTSFMLNEPAKSKFLPKFFSKFYSSIPYKSTIVTPMKNPNTDNELLGFVNMDSQKINYFRQEDRILLSFLGAFIGNKLRETILQPLTRA